MAKRLTEPLREVRAGESYPLPYFQKITGLGRAAVRTARMNGLRVTRQGVQLFVAGDDWLSYQKEQPNATID